MLVFLFKGFLVIFCLFFCYFWGFCDFGMMYLVMMFLGQGIFRGCSIVLREKMRVSLGYKIVGKVYRDVVLGFLLSVFVV